MTRILRSSSASLKSTSMRINHSMQKLRPKKCAQYQKLFGHRQECWLSRIFYARSFCRHSMLGRAVFFFLHRASTTTKKIEILDKPVNEMAVVSEVLRQDHWPPVKTPPMLAMVNAPIHTQNLPLYYFFYKFSPQLFSMRRGRVRLFDFGNVLPRIELINSLIWFSQRLL